MSTAARKARKRADVPFVKSPKKPTAQHGDPRGLGWISGPEIMARILARKA
ncbi:predicted ATP-dependent serine protease [Microbacterium sp. HM58-2]|nr:predicted ATP-dependent serine protease [Microbacterium sp. HM58-2]